MITATYTLFAPAGHEEEILEALRIFKGPTEPQRECLACAISQDADDPGIITYLEEWQTARALEDHIRSDHFRQLLFIIEMSVRAPEVRFRTAKETKGIEFIEALRGGG